MDLHYSQTIFCLSALSMRFTTLWIYTILKRTDRHYTDRSRFTTLWIYTILKHGLRPKRHRQGFTTLWIYTILKR